MMSTFGKIVFGLQTCGVATGLALTPSAIAHAQGRIDPCVDPDFGTMGEDDGNGTLGGAGGDERDDTMFQFEFVDIWYGTPWDPEHFGFPEWLFGGEDGGPGDDAPGDDDPGDNDPGDEDPGDEDPGDDEPEWDPGYTGTSYEWWSTAGEGCERVGNILHQFPPELVTVVGETLEVRLTKTPFTPLAKVRLPRPVPVPKRAQGVLGLRGGWVIAPGTYEVRDRVVRFALTGGLKSLR